MKLMPNEFAKQVTKWYRIYREHNPDYFLLEAQLTEKANVVGHLSMDDLVAIAKWGGNQYNRAGKVQRVNTKAEVREKTKGAIKNLANPATAFMSMKSIKQWGLAYATKTLRCICPRKHAALDSKLIKGISQSFLPSTDEVKRYEEFLNLCQQIRQKVTEPGPRENGEWFLADIEIALFQFIWDGGEII